MAFFKRFLRDRVSSPADPAPPTPVPVAPAAERRTQERHAVNQDFALKATLCYVGRDETGAPMSESRHGWNWKGRLIDCSEAGMRIQLGAGLQAVIGESCDLRLGIQDFEVTVPCLVANISETPQGVMFGLQHQIYDETARLNYLRIVEGVAIANTLKLQSRTPGPDDSGYVVEHYLSNRSARLTIWRHPADDSVSAFELQLSDCLLRAAEGQGLEYFTGGDAGSQPATAVQCHQIHQLFQWIVANLPQTVPADTREFLRRVAA